MSLSVEHQQAGYPRTDHHLAGSIHRAVGRDELYRRRHHVAHLGLCDWSILSDNPQGDVTIHYISRRRVAAVRTYSLTSFSFRSNG